MTLRIKDQFGIWNYSGSHPQAFKVHQEDDGYLSVQKCEKGATGRNVVSASPSLHSSM